MRLDMLESYHELSSNLLVEDCEFDTTNVYKRLNYFAQKENLVSKEYYVFGSILNERSYPMNQMNKALNWLTAGSQYTPQHDVYKPELMDISIGVKLFSIKQLGQTDIKKARILLDAYKEQLNNLQPKDIIILGHYLLPGEIDPNPDEIMSSIQWIVLSKEGSRLLLLSKHCLTLDSFEGETWSNSWIRRKLNLEKYIEWFTEEEKLLIHPLIVEEKPNPIYNAPIKKSRGDKDFMFLLSIQEVVRYMCNYDEKEINNHIVNGYLQEIGPNNADATILFGEIDKEDGVFVEEVPCNWWLRTPGSEFCMLVIGGQTVDLDGIPSDCDEVGLRPAMWIDINNLDKLLQYMGK